MKITKKELIELQACPSGLERFIAQTGNTDEAVEVSSLVGGENSYSDLLWLAGKKLPKKRIVRFTRDCALINIELIKPYTDDYDTIVEFLRNSTVGDAAWAAYTALRHTVHVTGDFAASRASRSALGAIRAGAYDAKYAAYAADNKEKVDELLRELFA